MRMARQHGRHRKDRRDARQHADHVRQHRRPARHVALIDRQQHPRVHGIDRVVERFVGALGTVYALSGSEDQIATSLVSRLQNAWSLPTALAVMAWYVYAPQCLATLAVAKRETNSWGWMFFMAGYLTAIAYLAAGITYWTATAIIG